MEQESPHRKWTADNGDFEGLKCPRWREGKLPKSNNRREMNHLPKNNQLI